MLLIIDAYNVLKQATSSKFIEEEQKTAFIKKLEKYAAQKNNKIIVVFDGGESYGPETIKIGAISVMYAGYGASADDLIKKLFMQKTINPLQVILVSSDRELCAFAYNFKIYSIDSHEFYSLLTDALAQKKQIAYKMHGALIKAHGYESTDEIDALMKEASSIALYKYEVIDSDSRKSASNTLSKHQKKAKRLIKKLSR